MMNRADAYTLLCEYVQDLGLRRHMLGVEAGMRAYARQARPRRGNLGHRRPAARFRLRTLAQSARSSAAGLRHPCGSSAIPKKSSMPSNRTPTICPIARAFIVLDKALYACDELTGLITAATLVRPGGILDMTASSVKKKMKSKGFARNVNRDDIARGAADFGVDLTEHIQFLIDALKPLAVELGSGQGAGRGNERRMSCVLFLRRQS